MLKSKLLATFYWLINGTKALNGKISRDKVTTINEKSTSTTEFEK